MASGQWNIAATDWTDGGTGSKSYVQIFAQETVSPAIDATQRFEMRVGSYEIIATGNSVLRDEFNDGEVATTTYYPAARGASVQATTRFLLMERCSTSSYIEQSFG